MKILDFIKSKKGIAILAIAAIIIVLLVVGSVSKSA